MEQTWIVMIDRSRKINYSSNKSSGVSAFFSWKSLVIDLLIKYVGGVKSAWFDRTCCSFTDFRIGYIYIGYTRNRRLIYEYCKVACNNFCCTCHYFVYILRWLITSKMWFSLLFLIKKLGKKLKVHGILTAFENIYSTHIILRSCVKLVEE